MPFLPLNPARINKHQVPLPRGIDNAAPLLWYDGSNIDGLGNSSLSEGSAIATWVNLGSASNANLVQVGVAQRPIFRQKLLAGSLKGHPGADFSRGNYTGGNGTWMATGAITAIPQPLTTIIVFQTDDNTAPARPFFFDNKTTSTGPALFVETTGVFTAYALGPTPTIKSSITTGIHYCIAQWNGASSSFRFDGVTSTGNPGVVGYAGEGFLLGAQGNSGSSCFGQIAEVIVYGNITVKTQDIERYLCSKYGVSTAQSWPIKIQNDGIKAPGNPVIWFDAANIDGARNTTLTNGQQIATWQNMGSFGSTCVATQTTGSLQPVYIASVSALGNKPCIDFFTKTGPMTTANFPSTTAQPYTWGVVWMQPTIGGASRVIFDTTTSTENKFYTDSVTTSGLYYAGTTPITAITNPVQNKWHYQIIKTNTTNTFRRADSTTIAATVSPGTNTLTTAMGVTLGALYDSTLPIQGYIAELLIWPTGSISIGEIEAYFNTKYGGTWPK